MGEPDLCHECRRSLGLVPDEEIVTARESIGFGRDNERMRTFCSTRCRCVWKGVDPVIDSTLQTTLAAFDGTASEAESFAYSQ